MLIYIFTHTTSHNDSNYNQQQYPYGHIHPFGGVLPIKWFCCILVHMFLQKSAQHSRATPVICAHISWQRRTVSALHFIYTIFADK